MVERLTRFISGSNLVKDNLSTISRALDRKYPLSEKLAAYKQECKTNAKLEAVCIAACEAGEFGVELLSYTARLPYGNELGLLGGIAVGGSYAVWHTYQHAKEHNAKPRLTDVIPVAVSMEAGCVFGATSTQYLAGKLFTSSVNPFSGINLAIRVAALPVAFGVGLAIMAGSTYYRNHEIFRFVGKKGNLEYLRQLLENDLDHTASDRSLTIYGKESELTISIKPLQCVHRNLNKHVIYIVKSPIARYDPVAKTRLKHAIENLLLGGQIELHPIVNSFDCTLEC